MGDGAGLEHSLFFFAAPEDGSATDTYRFILEAAERADQSSLAAVWIPERHFDAFGAPFPNPAVLAAALAVRTDRIQIRAGSVVLPLHDPVRVAEEWSMVQHLAGGRAGIAIASGWHPDDFVLAPHAYSSRREDLPEAVETLQALWAGVTLERRNGVGAHTSFRIHPAPLGQLPLWLTSASEVATWELAGRMGWNVLTALLEQTVDQVRDKAAAYRASRAGVGLDPQAGHVTVMAHSFVGPDLDAARAIVAAPLSQYLRRHLSLLIRTLGDEPEAARVTENDREALVQFAFERYFGSRGMFGTIEDVRHRSEELAAASVNEVAHLIDFGVDRSLVLDHLPSLFELAASAPASFGTRASSGDRW